MEYSGHQATSARFSEAGRASLGQLADRVERTAFVVAIGLSAFLLFSLELLIARLVLPVFGGAPAVWTTGLCFFTGMLFLGYVYAHVVAARMSPRAAGLIQIGFAAASVVVVVVAPTHVAGLRFAGVPVALNVMLVLTILAGAPAFLLATTTPLLSAWYVGRGRDPWWLFAVSNGASFAGLLAYPFLIEPWVGLSAQRSLLAVALAAYAVSLGPIIFRGRPTGVELRPASDRKPAVLTARRQTLWLVAALVPAGLLAATTNFLQTDLISAPLIWIGPLGIYLASFVVAFARRGRPLVRACAWLVPAAATLLWIPFIRPQEWPAVPLLVIELGALFVLAVAIHGGLAHDRPELALITRFYLVVTAGGALGTAFVALIAPLIFSTIYEYPILIVAGLIVLVFLPDGTVVPRAPIRVRPALASGATRLVPYAVAAGLLYLLVDAQQPATARDIRNLLLIGAIVVFMAVTPKILASAAPLALAVLLGITAINPLVRTRNFFGVVEVRQLDNAHAEFSGTTLHGLQFTDSRRSEPTTYYARAGPLSSVFEELRSRTSGARIGVVGLGVGTIAAYAKPGDEMTFYEINPAVVDIARDPADFTYLSDAAVSPLVVVGDGRLSLEAQPAASYDLLVLDAFSSDSVPTHLLTREAIQTYTRTLKPGGVLAFHLSNRYYDLVSPISATARSMGLRAMTIESSVGAGPAEQLGATDSRWLVVASSSALGGFVDRGWGEVSRGGYVLTDDYADLTRSLRLSGF